MKTYRVTVDGQSYEVTVEEVSDARTPDTPTSVPGRSASAPAARTAPSPAAPRAAAPPVTVVPGQRAIQAPMPGKILAVNVVQGDAVASGSVLVVLEAMKMENDILAPVDGKVGAVSVQNGDTVNTGDLLLVIEA